MSLWLDSLSREDPVSLVHSSHLALTRLLRTHRGKPIRRLWIDHPYGEEEIIHAQCIPFGLEVRSLACRRMGPVPARSCLRRSGARVM
jgi:hypothetical protein